MGRWLAVPPILTQNAPSHCAVPGAPAGVSIALFPELRGDVTRVLYADLSPTVRSLKRGNPNPSPSMLTYLLYTKKARCKAEKGILTGKKAKTHERMRSAHAF